MITKTSDDVTGFKFNSNGKIKNSIRPYEEQFEARNDPYNNNMGSQRLLDSDRNPQNNFILQDLQSSVKMLLEQQNQSKINDQINERELEFKIYQLELELQNKDQERLLVEQ